MGNAYAYAPILLSPSPLRALRACPESLEGERGTKGVRVPLLIQDIFISKEQERHDSDYLPGMGEGYRLPV